MKPGLKLWNMYKKIQEFSIFQTIQKICDFQNMHVFTCSSNKSAGKKRTKLK